MASAVEVVIKRRQSNAAIGTTANNLHNLIIGILYSWVRRSWFVRLNQPSWGLSRRASPTGARARNGLGHIASAALRSGRFCFQLRPPATRWMVTGKRWLRLKVIA